MVQTLVPGLLVGIFVGAAAAEEARHFVLRDGTKVPLTRSTTEWGVVLREVESTPDCAERLAAKGCGTLHKIAGSHRTKVRLLKGTETTARVRSVVLQDPEVVDVRPVYRFADIETPNISTGQIITKVRAGLTDVELQELWSDYQVAVTPLDADLPGVYVLTPTDPEHDEILRAEVLANDHRVRWAQPNLRRPSKLRQISTSDVFFPLQWHLNNTGQTGGTPDADIDAPDAWVLSEGQDILIGMFDDACDVDHEDLLEGYIGTGHDPTLESDQQGYTDPRPKQLGDSHGTSVMGLAVARANTLGVRGVAYLSTFTASRGVDSLLTDFDRAGAFTFARQQDVDVHINSWGVDGPNSAVVEEAVEVAFERGRPIDADADDPESLGMVIVWASGNADEENFAGFEYSTLPTVIGVGASNDRDLRASYSNYGVNVDMLAPGGEGDDGALTTTDNADRIGLADPGYNVGGEQEDGSTFDSAGRYNNIFTGTSASCPIVAGVSALVLSMNPRLTAADVRLILEHTCDAVSPAAAQYHPVTGRSVQYGYGRVNARRAVEKAQESLNNGGFSWPGRPFNIRFRDNEMRWQTSVGTEEFLVVEADSPFEFRAQDGECYSTSQTGCGGVAPEPLPSGARVAAVISCTNNNCDLGDEQVITADASTGAKYYGIFARNRIGRYSHGVAADTSGAVTDAGPVWAELTDGEGGGSGGGMGGAVGPRVTISVSPLEGQSPLRVRFRGNAVSVLPIDENRTQWDFDVDSLIDRTANTRDAEYVYVVAAGTRTFTARLTMYDTNGNVGSASVMIRASASGSSAGGDGSAEGSDVRILIGVPGNPTADQDEGTSPFDVQLSIDVESLNGTFQSIVWDLGDGSPLQRSLVVTHTYVNTSVTDLILPITVTVTTKTTGGAVLQTRSTRLITIHPGSSVPPANENENENENDNEDGGGEDGGCGPFGFAPFLGSLGIMMVMRRRR
jgi:hypothetical protein